MNSWNLDKYFSSNGPLLKSTHGITLAHQRYALVDNRVRTPRTQVRGRRQKTVNNGSGLRGSLCNGLPFELVGGRLQAMLVLMANVIGKGIQHDRMSMSGGVGRVATRYGKIGLGEFTRKKWED